MSDSVSHSIQECIFGTSKNQIFVNSSDVILSSTEAAAMLLSFSPHRVESLLTNCRKSKYKSYEEIEQQMQDDAKELSLVEDSRDLQSDIPLPASNLLPKYLPISGKKISVYFPDFELKQGVIQPTELAHPSNPDASKWIYTCCHAIEQQDGSSINVLFLQDVQELKGEYSKISREPVALDSVKKKISLKTPEYILETQPSYGDVITLRISEKGLVLEQFPLSQTFLGTDRALIHGSFIMGLIHPEDHIILSQCLSECLVSGTCHSVVRWFNSHSTPSSNNDKVEWIHLKATKSVNDTIILGVSQLCQPISHAPILEDSVKVVSDAWSYFSTSVATIGSSAGPRLSFFSQKNATPEVTADKNINGPDQPDPKILRTEPL